MVQKTPLFNMDYNDALTFAEHDLKTLGRTVAFSGRAEMNRRKMAMVQDNIELSSEFSRYVFEHPEIEDQLPADAEVVLLPEDNAELKALNRKMGKRMEAQGERVVYVSIKKLRPRTYSRIEGLELSHVG